MNHPDPNHEGSTTGIGDVYDWLDDVDNDAHPCVDPEYGMVPYVVLTALGIA
jgi:hypothetical protein